MTGLTSLHKYNMFRYVFFPKLKQLSQNLQFIIVRHDCFRRPVFEHVFKIMEHILSELCMLYLNALSLHFIIQVTDS